MNKIVNLFSKREAVCKKEEVIHEGWLQKESKFLKEWRDRWVVLTINRIYTFEQKENYFNPTETIDVNKIKTIKSDDKFTNNQLNIETVDRVYQFRCNSNNEKEDWLGIVGKTMMKQNSTSLIHDY